MNSGFFWNFLLSVNITKIVDSKNNQLKSIKYLGKIPAICVLTKIIIKANIIDNIEI